MKQVLQQATGLFLLCLSTQILSDVDDSSYNVGSNRMPPAQRHAMEQEFKRQQQDEDQRRQQALETAARQELERAAALAARPYPVRLLEARCPKCHKEMDYLEQAHTLPGWGFVVMRMKYFNGAELAHADMPVIATHLTEIRGLGGTAAVLEYAALPAVCAMPAFWIWWRRRRKQGLAPNTLTKERRFHAN